MKKLLLFIAILVSNTQQLRACGYSPQGESIRFSLFSPTYFNYSNYHPFYYNSDILSFNQNQVPTINQNIEDWFEFTEKKVPKSSIIDFLNNLTINDIHSNARNLLVQYLFKNKRYDVISYLKSAKESEIYNAFYAPSDPWERSKEKNNSARKRFIKQLILKSDAETNHWLKKRYAYLIIRLAYYDNDDVLLATTFEKNFANQPKNFLYYWSLYFYCFTDNSNYLNIAEVCAKSDEKRYATYYYFKSNFSLEKTIKTAHTKEEQANVYAYASLQQLDKSLENIKNIYQRTPHSEILDFLLLREINKLEDWIFTPYYSNFAPSIEYIKSYWNEQDLSSTLLLRSRSEKDRKYAQQLLNFVSSVNLKTVRDKTLWKAVKIQLQFMTRSYSECLQNCNNYLTLFPDEPSTELIQQIKTLCVIAHQTKGKAVIPKSVQNNIQQNFTRNKFLFAIGRELEYLGNISSAIALFSSIQAQSYSYEKVNINYVTWEGNRKLTSGNMIYFNDYFNYIDFIYSADNLSEIIEQIEKPKTDPFYQTLYKNLQLDKNRLKDLLGTKFIREERLNEALTTFKTVENVYWENNYNAWERDIYDNGPYAFDKNPFYDFKYTPDFIKDKEKYVVTKISILSRLINYIQRAEDTTNVKRAYYYFLVGNCYYNMSQNGNSWMMRRVYATRMYDEDESFIDEKEYRNNGLALHYYQLAHQHAKSKKFKALCLRMSEYVNVWPNRFTKTKENYPEYYESLSNCEQLSQFVGY